MSLSAIITMLVVQLTVTIITLRFLLSAVKYENGRRTSTKPNGKRQ